jgi:hypothetical protein
VTDAYDAPNVEVAGSTPARDIDERFIRVNGMMRAEKNLAG